MKTIAVIGSCVSRDIFNKLFIENHRDYFDCVLYQHQMSMISLVAKPIKYHKEDLNQHTLSKTNFTHLKSELDKSTLKKLKKLQPEYLLIDFYADTLYGVVEVEDSFITGKMFKFKDSKAGEKLNVGKAFFPRKHFKEFYEVWKKAFDKFVAYVRQEMPSTTIIINGAKTSSKVLDKSSNEMFDVNKYDIKKLNWIWNQMDQYAVNTYSLDYIDFADNEYYLDPEYPFGNEIGIVHYHKEFYRDCFAELKRITSCDQQH